MVVMKCPQCGADLEVDPNRKIVYCNYCGSKIFIDNDNEYTIHLHTTDDADVVRARTENMIKRHQIEMAEQYEADKRSKLRIRIWASIFLGIVAAILFAIGSLGTKRTEYFTIFGFWPLLAIVYIWLFYFSSRINKKEDALYGIIELPDKIKEYESQNYEVVESILRNSGFSNIKCIPMNDLTMGLLKKPGMVQSITINGTDISSGKNKFSKDADIIITYHSFMGK